MRKVNSDIIRHYPKISLSEERKLISKAQKGSKKSRNEIVLRHIGFLKFRIYKKVFPVLVRRFGEDLLEEAILILYRKIKVETVEKGYNKRIAVYIRVSIEDQTKEGYPPQISLGNLNGEDYVS